MQNPQNHAAAKVENLRALESNAEPNFQEMHVVQDGLDFLDWRGRRLNTARHRFFLTVYTVGNLWSSGNWKQFFFYLLILKASKF